MENIANNDCSCCYTKYEINDLFCKTCGFPFQGTEQDQKNFLSERNVKEIDLESLNEKVATACKSLYWLSGLTAFSAIVIYFSSAGEDQLATLMTNIFLILSFLGLGIWSKHKPTAAMITGLSLYLIVILLNAVISPMTIVSGLIVKIIVIGALIKGIKAVLEVDKLKKELNID